MRKRLRRFPHHSQRSHPMINLGPPRRSASFMAVHCLSSASRVGPRLVSGSLLRKGHPRYGETSRPVSLRRVSGETIGFPRLFPFTVSFGCLHFVSIRCIGPPRRFLRLGKIVVAPLSF